MAENILDEIVRIKDLLPKKQQKLCTYLALNYKQVGVMTVAELAQAAGVSTTTVMRLVQTLGRPSFSVFKKELLDASLMRTTTSYLSLKETFHNEETEDGNNLLYRVVNDGMQVLQNLCTTSNTQQFQAISDLLFQADRIFTIGLRSSKALALYCEYSLSTFHPQVIQLSNDTEFIYDRVGLKMKSTDVLLVFSAWPCTRKTIEVAEYCHSLGIPVALVTNTSLNPIIKFAQAVVDTNSVNHPSGDMVFMAVIEALVAELGRRTAPQSTQNVERIEAILSEKKIVQREY